MQLDGLLCLILLLPYFPMVFIYKCIDLIAYKKLHLVNRIKKTLLIDLLIVFVSEILFLGFIAGSVLLVHTLFKPQSSSLFTAFCICFVFGILLSNILSLIIMHRIERKKMNCCLEKPVIHKNFFITNITLVCLADVLFFAIFGYDLYVIATTFQISSSDECYAITALVFPLIKIVFAIVFTRANSKKLKALPEEALQTEKI